MSEGLIYEGSLIALLLSLLGIGSKRMDRLNKRLNGTLARNEFDRINALQDERFREYREDNKEQHRDLKDSIDGIYERLNKVLEGK